MTLFPSLPSNLGQMAEDIHVNLEGMADDLCSIAQMMNTLIDLQRTSIKLQRESIALQRNLIPRLIQHKNDTKETQCQSL